MRTAQDAVTATMTRGFTWAHASPPEALEALMGRGLAPPHWLDPGRSPGWEELAPEVLDASDARCDLRLYEDGQRWWRADVPLSFVALASVACLGVGAIERVEAVVTEAWPGRRLVWRIMSAAAVLAMHKRASRTGTRAAVAAFSNDALLEHHLGPDSKHSFSAWDTRGPPMVFAGGAVEAVWLHLCALGREGVHLARLDDGSVTIAVVTTC